MVPRRTDVSHTAGAEARSQTRMTHSALFENSPDPTVAISVSDGEPIVDSVNPAFQSTFGFDAAEAVGRSLNDLIVPPESLDTARQIDAQAKAGDPVDREVRRETVDGTRDFLLRSIPVHGEVDYYGVYRDVTERREREEQLRALFENASTAIAYCEFEDGEPIVVAVNPAFERTFGYDEGMAVGRSIDEIIVPPGRESEAAAINDEAIAGTPVETEVRRRTASGVRDFFLRSVPVQPETGGKRIYAIYRDISERKERERELRHQNERLDEFASLVSHDLRNPLNVAQGRLDLARAEADSDHLETVADAHDRMETLIEDLLELARQGGRIESLEPVALDDVTRGCWVNVATADATLEVATDATIRADRSRLQNLLENLFRNAVEHGGTDVTVTVSGLPDGFAVADDGVGVPADRREEVFETGVSTADGGTGFGLSIVQQIAEAHGWAVTVTESDGGGARFEVTGVETAAVD
jgi:PAS domain S-box-containing protein